MDFEKNIIEKMREKTIERIEETDILRKEIFENICYPHESVGKDDTYDMHDSNNNLLSDDDYLGEWYEKI